jgi:hypothetical protein
MISVRQCSASAAAAAFAGRLSVSVPHAGRPIVNRAFQLKVTRLATAEVGQIEGAKASRSKEPRSRSYRNPI